MDKKRALGTLSWFSQSFGPLVVFYACEHLFGLLAAIISGIVTGAALVAWQVAKERKVSPFTAFIATSVVAFGILDLRYQTGFFVKLEPALGNAVTGAFFIGSVLWGAPIIVELAERSLGRKLDKARRYLATWTVLWGLFFFLRATAYVWMAYNVTVDRALAIRGVLGPLSFGVMIVGEMLVRRLIYGEKALRQPEPAVAAAESDDAPVGD